MPKKVPTTCQLCGCEFLALPCFLRRGRARFCSRRCMGQWHSVAHQTHAGSKTRLYRIWGGIKTRCNTPSATGFRDYGARGIRVCAEWGESFEAFRSWAMASGYSDELTIDRRDGDGNYEPGNCRWIKRAYQNRNKKKSRRPLSSSYKGVSWHIDTKAWQARIFLDGKSKYLGVYSSEEEAARVYDAAALANFGEFAQTNFALTTST